MRSSLITSGSRSWLLAVLIASVSLVASAGAEASQPGKNGLAPPEGEITPTMKTLDEVQPRAPLAERFVGGSDEAVFVITRPGSYYLAGDLDVSPNKFGVRISAAPVTLDLMGHAINGNGASDDLIHIDALADRVVVRNGTLRRSGERGVDSYGDSVHLEMLEIVETRRSGVALDTGRAATLRDISVADVGTAPGADSDGVVLMGPGAVRARALDITDTGGVGLRASERVRLTLADSFVSDTDSDGIHAGDRAVVRNVRVNRAGGHGIRAGRDTIVESSQVESARDDGIVADDRAHVRDNRVYARTGDDVRGAGVRVTGSDAVIDGNTIVGPGSEAGGYHGVRLEGTRSLLARNRAYDTAGFTTGAGNLVGSVVRSAEGYASTPDPDANFEY